MTITEWLELKELLQGFLNRHPTCGFSKEVMEWIEYGDPFDRIPFVEHDDPGTFRELSRTR